MQEDTALISERLVLHGIVRNGVIIPDKGFSLPDGAAVQITLAADHTDLPETYHAETAAWDQAGADAWAWIENMERDEAEQKVEA